MSILYKTTRFADTFTGDKDTNIRVRSGIISQKVMHIKI